MSDPRRWSEDYVAHVLRPNFSQAKRYLFKPLLMANKAHAVMLERCGLLEHSQAKLLLSALRDIDAAGSRSFAYTERIEDLYFAVESRLIELAGVDAGGNLQIARSRNDLDAANPPVPRESPESFLAKPCESWRHPDRFSSEQFADSHPHPRLPVRSGAIRRQSTSLQNVQNTRTNANPPHQCRARQTVKVWLENARANHNARA